mmetsp:Transcript_13212/g.41789  ORF Transcript_13212/g.41789 Transcript_13212/m.41789 type:complete len:232 (+) Transcript_13212:645-1340(+)
MLRLSTRWTSGPCLGAACPGRGARRTRPRGRLRGYQPRLRPRGPTSPRGHLRGYHLRPRLCGPTALPGRLRVSPRLAGRPCHARRRVSRRCEGGRPLCCRRPARRPAHLRGLRRRGRRRGLCPLGGPRRRGRRRGLRPRPSRVTCEALGPPRPRRPPPRSSGWPRRQRSPRGGACGLGPGRCHLVGRRPRRHRGGWLRLTRPSSSPPRQAWAGPRGAAQGPSNPARWRERR